MHERHHPVPTSSEIAAAPDVRLDRRRDGRSAPVHVAPSPAPIRPLRASFPGSPAGGRIHAGDGPPPAVMRTSGTRIQRSPFARGTQQLETSKFGINSGEPGDLLEFVAELTSEGDLDTLRALRAALLLDLTGNCPDPEWLAKNRKGIEIMVEQVDECEAAILEAHQKQLQAAVAHQAPDSISIFFQSGKVVRVDDELGRAVPFVTAVPELIPAGTVVLLAGRTAIGTARFAEKDTKVADLGRLPKVTIVEQSELESEESSEEDEPVTKKFEELDFKFSLTGGLMNIKFTGFEGAEKGWGHFDKHIARQKELDIHSKADYIRVAKAFGETQGGCYEALIGNTSIKIDPPGGKIRRVFIANGKQIRTFYVWSPTFSKDPFAFAICYTIVKGLRRPLGSVSKLRLQQLLDQGIDVVAARAEVKAASKV